MQSSDGSPEVEDTKDLVWADHCHLHATASFTQTPAFPANISFLPTQILRWPPTRSRQGPSPQPVAVKCMLGQGTMHCIGLAGLAPCPVHQFQPRSGDSQGDFQVLALGQCTLFSALTSLSEGLESGITVQSAPRCCSRRRLG